MKKSFLILHKPASPSARQKLCAFIFIALMLTGLNGWPSFASEYYVQGGLYIRDILIDASGGSSAQVALIDRSLQPFAGTSIADSQMQLGPKGEHAKAAYYGNLATGRVGAFVNAVNAYDHNDDIWGETEARTDVLLFDTIYFNISAGTYTNGANAILKGYVDGSMSDSLYGQSRFSFAVHFGSQDYVLQGAGDHTQVHSDVYHENFTITLPLVQPGITLNADQTLRQGFYITLGGPGTLVTSTMGNKTGNKQSTSAEVDFFNTGRIVDFSVPDGITWTSASGVLFSEVPLPPSLFLLLSGLVGVFGWHRKRRQVYFGISMLHEYMQKRRFSKDCDENRVFKFIAYRCKFGALSSG